ncbi:MAG: DUF6351 family protein, partial [Mycobacteriales bacterium]
MRPTRTLAATTAVAAAAAVLPFLPTASADAATLGLTVLSGRADLVSGGDALVAVTGASSLRGLRVTAAGRDVTRAFGLGPGGKVEGLVTGLPLGRSTVVVRGPLGGAQLTLTDHRIGGPVLAGPQIQPWACQATARDAQCDEPPTYTYSYLPVGTTATTLGASGVASVSSFQAYDPASPPPAAAIATTTTDTGVTVPFIVRK